MVIKYGMRFPDGLYTRIVASAKRNSRSVHGQILWLIDQALLREENARDSPPT